MVPRGRAAYVAFHFPPLLAAPLPRPSGVLHVRPQICRCCALEWRTRTR
jgi:hypothetical protein